MCMCSSAGARERFSLGGRDVDMPIIFGGGHPIETKSLGAIALLAPRPSSSVMFGSFQSYRPTTSMRL